jgi:hypothetical protein
MASRLGREMMEREARHPSANRGRSTVMGTTGALGALTLIPTLLIAEEHPDPNEWVITIAPPTTQLQGPTIPYNQAVPIDGTTTPPTTANTNLPALPGAGLQMNLRWASGGITFNTQFDYPVLGGTFGLTAETVNLDVVLKPWPLPVTFASVNVVPVVAAFMTPGRAADPTPLYWQEQPTGVTEATSAYWIVKPYARKLHITSTGIVFTAGDQVFIEWGAIANGALFREQIAIQGPAGNGYIDSVFDVPAGAQYVRFANTATNELAVTLNWRIGLT